MDLATPQNLEIIDHLLTTTRSVRKRLDLDRPVARSLIEDCLEIAIQAPTASNRQNWHFVVVTDAEKRRKVGTLYRRSFDVYRPPVSRKTPSAGSPATQMARVLDSAAYLAENMHRAPVLIIPCIESRSGRSNSGAMAGLYGSILPAAWSLMLALRARGLGSAWTTLHLRYEREVAEILGIPDTIVQAALLPVAYFKGDDFKPAKRRPSKEFTYWDGWGQTG
jgi:nitroreductase